MDVASRFRTTRDPSRAARGSLLAALVFALLGVAFSAVSTLDSIEHLDRQVHSIHCSFVPGAGADFGESGCRTAMLSPYSSFFRQSLWGGIPVALWSLAVFSFLAWRAAVPLWRGETDRRETGFLLAAFGLPVLTSLVFAYLAVVELEALCKVCVGIYVASLGGFVAALRAHRRALPGPGEGGGALWARGIAGGVAFVAILTAVYVVGAPEAPVKGCGELVRDDDPAGILLAISPAPGKPRAIEVVDPLCPSCKALEKRLLASDFGERLDLRAVLFPLDPACNWMVKEALHPGSCLVSEAVLCAGPLSADGGDPAAAGARARRVLAYAYDHQEEIRAEASHDEAAVRARLERQFPEVKGCLGGVQVKNKLVKGLRWAVANAIPVLTPQLFVGKTRLCDEDTDLGLEFTLARMLEGGVETAGPAPVAGEVR